MLTSKSWQHMCLGGRWFTAAAESFSAQQTPIQLQMRKRFIKKNAKAAKHVTKVEDKYMKSTANDDLPTLNEMSKNIDDTSSTIFSSNLTRRLTRLENHLENYVTTPTKATCITTKLLAAIRSGTTQECIEACRFFWIRPSMMTRELIVTLTGRKVEIPNKEVERMPHMLVRPLAMQLNDSPTNTKLMLSLAIVNGFLATIMHAPACIETLRHLPHMLNAARALSLDDMYGTICFVDYIFAVEAMLRHANVQTALNDVNTTFNLLRRVTHGRYTHCLKSLPLVDSFQVAIYTLNCIAIEQSEITGRQYRLATGKAASRLIEQSLLHIDACLKRQPDLLTESNSQILLQAVRMLRITLPSTITFMLCSILIRLFNESTVTTSQEVERCVKFKVLACHTLSLHHNFADQYLNLTQMLTSATKTLLQCINQLNKKLAVEYLAILLSATCINWFCTALTGRAPTLYKSPPMIRELASQFLIRLSESNAYIKKPPTFVLAVLQSLLYWNSVKQLHLDSSQQELAKHLIEKLVIESAKRNEKRITLLENFFTTRELRLMHNVQHENGYFSPMMAHFEDVWYDVDYPWHFYFLSEWNDRTRLMPNGLISWRIAFARTLCIPQIMIMHRNVHDKNLPLGAFMQREIDNGAI